MSIRSNHFGNLEEAKLDTNIVSALSVKWKSLESEVIHQRKIRIDEACDGQQAFEMFKKCYENSGCTNPECKHRGYRVIIMDLQMPVLDGYEASEKILKYQRENNLSQQCSIVALTAFTTNGSIQRCHKIGMKKVYNKPASSCDIKEIMLMYHYDLTKWEALLYMQIENYLKL